MNNQTKDNGSDSNDILQYIGCSSDEPIKPICVNCKFWLAEHERVESLAKKVRYLETTRSRHPRKFNLYPTRDEIKVNGRNWGARCTQLPEIISVWINTQFFNDDNKEPEKNPTLEPLQNQMVTGWSFGCNQFQRYTDEG